MARKKIKNNAIRRLLIRTKEEEKEEDVTLFSDIFTIKAVISLPSESVIAPAWIQLAAGEWRAGILFSNRRLYNSNSIVIAQVQEVINKMRIFFYTWTSATSKE